jgi:hypothetical protein
VISNPPFFMDFGVSAKVENRIELMQYYWAGETVTNITAVPESGTVSMILLGLAGIGGVVATRGKRVRS